MLQKEQPHTAPVPGRAHCPSFCTGKCHPQKAAGASWSKASSFGGLKRSASSGYTVKQEKMHQFGEGHPQILVCSRHTLFPPVRLVKLLTAALLPFHLEVDQFGG